MRSISSRGPIVFTYVLFFWVRKWTLKKKKVTVVVWFWRSFFLKMFYCAGGRTDGWTGGRVDGEQKGPLIFFILRYIKHYTHIYLYTKEKLSGQISCGFKILDKLGVRRNKIKNTLLVGFFKNQSKSQIFIKEITCKFYREFILKGILLYFFSRSEKFIKDFSCKF